jgi:hypothetical protein
MKLHITPEFRRSSTFTRITRMTTRRSAVVCAAAAMLLAAGTVSMIEPADAQLATGPDRPVLALLCAYPGLPTFDVTAAQIQATWVGNGSIDSMVREVSLGTVNVAGSQAFGWYTLPKTKEQYGGSPFDVFTDCLALARAAGVDPSGFMHAIAYSNEDFNGGIQGITFPRDFGGRSNRVMAVNWRGLNSPGLVLHELGHAWRGIHTESVADGLGGGARYSDNPRFWKPGDRLRFNNVGPGWDGFNRDRMGFIPAARKVVFQGGTQTIDGAQFKDPANDFGRNSWMLPTAGVFISRVTDSLNGLGTSTVVLSRPGGDRETTDGVWLPGQTYTDAANGVTIAVNAFDDNGAQITVTGPQAPATTTVAPTTAAPTTVAPATVAPPTGGGGTGPATDNLADAPAVTVRTGTPLRVGPQSTAAATSEVGEPAPCGRIANTVWVRFVAAETGTITATTFGSDYDTVLATYRGPAAGATFAGLAALGCNDDANGGSQSFVTFPVTAGETYYVQAGGFGGAKGNLTLNLG